MPNMIPKLLWIGKQGNTSENLIRLLIPRLDSDDFIERVTAAGNLGRINRSEKAYAVLQQETVGDN